MTLSTGFHAEVAFIQSEWDTKGAAKSSGAGRMLSHPGPAPNPTDVLPRDVAGRAGDIIMHAPATAVSGYGPSEAEIRHHERQLCCAELLMMAQAEEDLDCSFTLRLAARLISRREVA